MRDQAYSRPSKVFVEHSPTNAKRPDSVFGNYSPPSPLRGSSRCVAPTPGVGSYRCWLAPGKLWVEEAYLSLNERFEPGVKWEVQAWIR